MSSFVIGLDYGTDSVRAVLVDVNNGNEVASSVFNYPRWRDGMYCDPASSQFRQHPLDYLEGLQQSVRDCLKAAGPNAAKNVKAISVDTTGSTPVAVDRQGTPLSLLPEFSGNPNAMFVLWKDHTATKEAAEINNHAAKFKPDYLKYVGGIYSSEWFWAKLLHVLRTDEKVRGTCHSWVEHCDWIPFLLTGGSDAKAMKRGVCSAGHKALWAEEFGGLPEENFFTSLDSKLAGFWENLFTDTYTADKPAGRLSSAWASKLGLNTDVLVGVGAFDAHMGAVGGQIEPYHLSKVMGTSTCDMLVAPREEMRGRLVRGICGQVDGSIIPGMIGLEAGQSAFGDTYAWFKDLVAWPIRNFVKDEGLATRALDSIIPELSRQAEKLGVKNDDVLSLDWLNGRRTPDANQELKAAISGMNLATDAPAVFKSLVEGTCFGARAIVDRFIKEGIPVRGLIGLGGVARKSPYVMQVMANVIGMPLRIHASEQTCAAGAAMFAATVAGIYPKVEDAMAAMGRGFDLTYQPDASVKELYNRRYQHYLKLGEQIQQNTMR
jgi:L-ribulokinase